MVNIRDILLTMNKEELLEEIIETSDYGYFPIGMILAKADFNFSLTDLEELWESVLDWANNENDKDSDLASDALAKGAEKIFEAVQNIQDNSEVMQFCEKLANDLREASECNGIGMETDSEWQYMEICEKIEEYCGK